MALEANRLKEHQVFVDLILTKKAPRLPGPQEGVSNHHLILGQALATWPG